MRSFLARPRRRGVTLAPMALPPSRSFLPRSLFGRALTILLVPIVVLQLVVGLVFFQRHYQRVTEQMTRNVAYELAYAVERDRGRRRRRGARRARIAELALPLDLWLRLEPGATLAPGVDRDFFDITGAKRRRDARSASSTGRSRSTSRRPARRA